MTRTSDAPAGAAAPSAQTAARLALRGVDGRLTRAGRLALVVVCVAVFLTALDQTVVLTVLPAMIADIGVPVAQLDHAAWIVSGYLLGYVVVMPLMGRIADIYGRWRVFALCLTLFGLGSLLCALAPRLGSPIAPDFTTLSGALLTPLYRGAQALLPLLARLGIDVSAPGLVVLVAARFVQAVGGGAVVPVAMAVAGDLFGQTRRGLALGLVGAVTEAGGVVGPLWGALITRALGWPWIFYLNVPLVALLLAAGFWTLPRRRGAREPVDLFGALLFGAALTCLTIGLGSQTGQPAFSAVAQIALDPRLLIASLVLLLLFVALELTRRWPVVQPRMFRRAAFSAASLLSLLVGVALVIALAGIPLFMETLRGQSAIEGGLAALRMTVLIPVGALAGGWLTRRLGCPPAAVIGVLLTAAGLWLMHLWPADVGELAVTLATVSAGLGFGFVIAPISTSALNSSAPGQAGSASAVATALRMTGMILGLAGLTAWGLSRFKTLVAARVDQLVALHQVYTDIFAAAAIIVLLGALPALLLWRRRRGDVLAAAGEYDSFVAPLA